MKMSPQENNKHTDWFINYEKFSLCTGHDLTPCFLLVPECEQKMCSRSRRLVQKFNCYWWLWWWIALRMNELEKQFRLKEAEVRVSFHHVLDAPLGSVERVLVGIVWLDIVERNHPRFRVKVHLWGHRQTDRRYGWVQHCRLLIVNVPLWALERPQSHCRSFEPWRTFFEVSSSCSPLRPSRIRGSHCWTLSRGTLDTARLHLQ